MCNWRSRLASGVAAAAAIAASATLVGCNVEMPEQPAYVVGRSLPALRFELYSVNEGIYPDTSVLDDTNNPFRFGLLGPKTKWQVNDKAGDVGAFYGWATMLALQPTGEHQFYAAKRLADVWANGEAPDADPATLKAMVVRAYQSVLDNFPDSVTYDAQGKQAFRLAPLAFNAIRTLTGTPPAGWIEVALPDGGTDVVRTNP